MTESKVYQEILRPLCKEHGIMLHSVDYYAFPDAYLSKNGEVLWAEIKCVNKSSSVIKPDWRPGQLSWIKRNSLYGSNNVCLLLWYEGRVWFLQPKEKYSEEELICQKMVYLKTMW